MKKTIVSLFLALSFFMANSQQLNYDITGIKRIYANDLRAIIENNEVKGYYAFYFLDKANKKENLYNLAILDNTLKQTYSVELKKGRNLRLLESAYNGDHFCFSFADFGGGNWKTYSPPSGMVCLGLAGAPSDKIQRTISPASSSDNCGWALITVPPRRPRRLFLF